MTRERRMFYPVVGHPRSVINMIGRTARGRSTNPILKQNCYVRSEMSKARLLFPGLLCAFVVTVGCTNKLKDTSATAIIRINRDQFAGSASEFLIYQETLASLLKSQLVANTALRKIGRSDLDAQSIQAAIQAKIQEGSELLTVEMDHARLDLNQTQHVLNQVVEAFFDEVVNKDRLEDVEALSKLRKRYTNIFNQVKKKTDEIGQLSKQLGSSDSSQAQALLAIKIDTLKHIQRRLTDTEMKRAKWKLMKDDRMIAVAEATIAALESRYETVFAEIQQIGGVSGDLEARKSDLVGLKRDMQKVRESMQQLEVELDGPARVVVIQAAH